MSTSCAYTMFLFVSSPKQMDLVCVCQLGIEGIVDKSALVGQMLRSSARAGLL